ncbi:MAG: glycosyltransferase [Gemmatimonadaceae bacterium]|nr:glycosyltransferase [Gemmatimonadaceae bacterium]
MRLLIITHAFAPGRNPRAFRWTALAEHWAQKGHDVVVLTGSVPGLPNMEFSNGVEVHRVGAGWIEKIRARLAPQVAHTPICDDARDQKPVLRTFRLLVRKALKRLHDLTWKNIYWPDFAAPWILPAIREGARLLQQQPTIVITVSIPFSSHLVGYFLHRRGLVSQWIADIGDPFAFMVEAPTNNHAIYGGLNFRVEKAVLYAADAISVTTESTLKRYLATFPLVDGKIFEIPPLSNSPRSAPAESVMRAGKTRLVFTGTLYQAIRGPDRVLALFAKMLAKQGGDLELHFYGNYSEVTRTFEALPQAVRRHVFLHGEVSRDEAVEAMRSASALINIGNDTTYQLPSKLVEYAATGKPVINVVARQNDSSVVFFKRHPCVFNVIGDAASGDNVAHEALAFLESARHRVCTPDAEWLSRFSIDSVSGQYEELFDHRLP